MEPDEIMAYLLSRAAWTASRSSGPGGQHRDKASTRAELTLAAESLAGLEPELRDRLAQGLGLDARPLRITVQDERSLARNQEIAAQRLTVLVARVLAPRPRRRPTRLGASRRRARLTAKVRRGETKRLRRPPDDPA